MNFPRKTFPRITDAEEEFAIDYENSCHDDSGFHDIPPTPASAFSLEKFQQSQPFLEYFNLLNRRAL